MTWAIIKTALSVSMLLYLSAKHMRSEVLLWDLYSCSQPESYDISLLVLCKTWAAGEQHLLSRANIMPVFFVRKVHTSSQKITACLSVVVIVTLVKTGLRSILYTNKWRDTLQCNFRDIKSLHEMLCTSSVNLEPALIWKIVVSYSTVRYRSNFKTKYSVFLSYQSKYFHNRSWERCKAILRSKHLMKKTFERNPREKLYLFMKHKLCKF